MAGDVAGSVKVGDQLFAVAAVGRSLGLGLGLGLAGDFLQHACLRDTLIVER